MTPLDLIRLALRDAGVNGQGQSPSDEDNNDAFLHLNMMLDEWNIAGALVWHNRDVWCASNGNATYLLGPGYDFPCQWVSHLEAAFVRFIFPTGGVRLGDPIGGMVLGDSQIGLEADGSDYPLTVLNSRQDYNRAMVKGIGPTPYYVFYDASYPVGEVHFYPVPAVGAYELHLTVKSQMMQFANLTDDIIFPPGYLSALLFNLGLRLRLSYQMAPDAALERRAAASLALIAGNNTMIPNLMMPSSLPAGRARFNIYSGRGG